MPHSTPAANRQHNTPIQSDLCLTHAQLAQVGRCALLPSSSKYRGKRATLLPAPNRHAKRSASFPASSRGVHGLSPKTRTRDAARMRPVAACDVPAGLRCPAVTTSRFARPQRAGVRPPGLDLADSILDRRAVYRCWTWLRTTLGSTAGVRGSLARPVERRRGRPVGRRPAATVTVGIVVLLVRLTFLLRPRGGWSSPGRWSSQSETGLYP
jgi:hypothetical protein